MATAGASGARIYTLADRNYFVGVVALLNSLRLTGNTQELVVLDCGLEERQRVRLSAHTTVVPLPPQTARSKTLAKPYIGTLASASEIMIYVDSDVLVTASLAPIAALAARGSICLFPVDWPEQRARNCPEWQRLFQLRAPLRKQVYANAGFLALSAGRWPDLLARWDQLCAAVPEGATFSGEISTNPLWAGDQDALNALLMSEVPAEAVCLLPEEESVFPPMMEHVEVEDADALLCTLGGAKITMLHYSWVPKPWAPRAWRRMQRPLHDAYARILPRVLFGDDVSLLLEPHEVPAWLRRGAVAAAARNGVALARTGRRLGARAATRLPNQARGRLLALRDRFEPPERGVR